MVNNQSKDNKKKVDAVVDDNASADKKPAKTLALSEYRRFLSSLVTMDKEDDDGDDGDGVAELKPEASEEFDQRVLRRQEEEQYSKHVREARDPEDNVDPDHQQGMGAKIKTHPLLAQQPRGTEAPWENKVAENNQDAQNQYQLDYEKKLQAQLASSSMPTPRAQ
jgi:hypothetical protein